MCEFIDLFNDSNFRAL